MVRAAPACSGCAASVVCGVDVALLKSGPEDRVPENVCAIGIRDPACVAWLEVAAECSRAISEDVVIESGLECTEFVAKAITTDAALTGETAPGPVALCGFNPCMLLLEDALPDPSEER